jgi:uncharacterized membrane protein YtjA (UPF0391 family)
MAARGTIERRRRLYEHRQWLAADVLTMEDPMLYWALIFLLIALVAGLFGFGGIASASAGIAQILFFVFLVLLVISLVMYLVRGRQPPL